MTFWDAGEFVAAASSFGIPHPPGTPLYVLLARAAVVVAGEPRASAAVAVLSALSTAGACGIGGALVARWLGDWWAGLAAGVAAGVASTVWLSATEPEVYSVALLLVAATLWCADRARGAGLDARVPTLAAYAVALAVPLHLSALVAVPAVAALATNEERARWRVGALLAATGTAAAGVATTSVPLGALGLAALALLAATDSRARRGVGAATLALLAACSVLLVLPLRAAHDPAVNQGNPASWARLVAVVGRAQYDNAGLWPRQAPAWLQLANVLQYADWQFGLALAPGPPPTAARVAATLLFVVLGALGARALRRTDGAAAWALALLVAGGSVGVAAYLNLKAGPSLGWGVLPDDAPHEARERDYFFALAAWGWGLWAGAGAVAAVRRVGAAPALGAALAAAPIAANWGAVDRRREPAASLPRRYASALLHAAPARAVVFAGGDNDSYPAWYAQQSLGIRRDVTVVTVPLLPAAWYRAELARRHALVPAADTGGRWRGAPVVLRAIADAAARAGRPVAATAIVEPTERAAIAAAWRFDGILFHGAADGGTTLDRAAARRHAAALAPLRARAPHEHAGTAARHVFRLLGCPAAVGAAGGGGVADSLLASVCKLR